MKPHFIRTVALSLWMYFGGPLVWGAWMVWRLGIYTPLDFWARMWPLGLTILSWFFVANCLNLCRVRQSVIKCHYALIAALGVIGTAVFLLGPPVLHIRSTGVLDQQTIMQAVRGVMAGIALIGLFYPFFSTTLLANMPGFQEARLFVSRCNRSMFLVGLFAYAGSAFWSVYIAVPTLTDLIGLILPLLMGSLLSWKTHRSIRLSSGDC